MKDPLVTIVTPSFNQGPFIRATIESVLAQDYPAIEYIVMDGGSTDETASIVREYSSRLRFVSEPDRGQSHAINKGFQEANGQVVAWVNSDDMLLDGAVRTAVEALREHPRAGAIYGEGFFMDADGNLTARFPYTRPFDLWRLIHLSDYILQQSVFFRRSAVAAAGWVREDLYYTMDWDLLIRIGKRQPLHRIPEYLGCLREYGATKTASGGARRVAEIRQLLREHTGLNMPPGWILYGLDTYAEMVCRKISRFSRSAPRFLNGLTDWAQMGVLDFCSALSGRLTCQTNGWHSDGWIGPSMDYWLSAMEGPVTIYGEMPPNPWLHGQHLTVKSNGMEVGRFPVQPGPFNVTVYLKPIAEGEPIRLRLEPSHTFIPGLSWENNLDMRPLAFLVHRLRWLEYDIFPPGQDPDRELAELNIRTASVASRTAHHLPTMSVR